MINEEQILSEAERIFEFEISALQKLKAGINISYADAVKLILNSNKLIVSGIGKSGLIGKKIAATFSSLGKPSFFLHSVDSLHGDIGIVEKDDVIILLSKSGSTEEIVRLIPYLKGRNARIIALTGNSSSYLSRNADVVIDCSVEREACPLDIVPTSSTTASLVAGDALAACYMIATGLTLETFSLQHPLGQIGRNITLQVKDVMHKDGNLPYLFENASFKDAIIEISNKGLGCVAIVDDFRILKGIITDGDVRRTLSKYDNISDIQAGSVMTSKPISIDEDAYLGEATALMEQRISQISVLPVVDKNNKLKGIIRIHDIIRSGL